MDNLNELQKLLNTSSKVTNAIKQYKEVYLADEKHFDKLGFGFNLDNRFSACNSLTLYVSSWKGTYGNSGSSTILDVDDKIFNKHLLKVLSGDFWQIMDKVSKSIRSEAISLKDKAQKELEERLEKVKSLNEEITPTIG